MNLPSQIIVGDCLSVLKTLPDESVHCCVTSPPYYRLRDYGVEGQIGLEETIYDYIQTLCSVFDEVKRILRYDGVLWLNLGDKFAGNRSYQVADSKHTDVGNSLGSTIPQGLKPKDLLGIPWRVAFELQNRGWWLRSDIIWSKGNAMPESVMDRPTRAHEYLFLLSKNRKYYYDHEAIKEDSVCDHPSGNGFKRPQQISRDGRGNDEQWMPTAKRNKRSVWTINTTPFPGAHFAVFPESLVIPCILAGTSSKGCCAVCGVPWERIVERETENRSNAAKAGTMITGKGHVSSQVRSNHDVRNGPVSISHTTGWKPSCDCGAETTPCTVVDPFSGAGTTVNVAQKLGRRGIGMELNPEYALMSIDRIRDDNGMFANVQMIHH